MPTSRMKIEVGVRADGAIAVGLTGVGVFFIDRDGARGLSSDLLWACEMAENPALSPNLDVLPGLPVPRGPAEEDSRCHGKAQSPKPGKPQRRKPGKPRS